MKLHHATPTIVLLSQSGGFKLADLPGAIANRVVRNRLSDWMGPHEAGVHETARAVWAAMLSVPHTREAAHRMVEYLDGTALRRATRIPGTGFNAYRREQRWGWWRWWSAIQQVMGGGGDRAGVTVSISTGPQISLSV